MENQERIPMCFCYRCRWPSDGEDLTRQLQKRAEAYYRLLSSQPQTGAIQWGGWYVDEGASAFDEPMLQRPQGRLLDGKLCSDDHVIFAGLDRSVRNPADLVELKRDWDAHSILIHLADFRLDLSSPEGQLFMEAFTVAVAFRTNMTRLRSRENAARLKAESRPASGSVPLGFKSVGKKGNRFLVPDAQQRQVMRRIVHLRDEHALSWAKVSDRIEETLAKREGRPAINPVWGRRPWSGEKCRRAYFAEQKLQADEVQSETYRSRQLQDKPEKVGGNE